MGALENDSAIPSLAPAADNARARERGWERFERLRRLGALLEEDSHLSSWFLGGGASLLLVVPIAWCIQRRLAPLRKSRVERIQDSFGFLPDSCRTSLTHSERMV